MENLGWGLQMTVLGMGLVFLLLALLWGLLTLVLALDKTAEPKPDSVPETIPASPQEIEETGLPADLVAAIAAAALRHRSVLRREAARRGHHARTDEDASGSRWVATGRTRQNVSWQPRGK